MCIRDSIIALSTLAWQEYGVRAVIHPHAGGSIEFADEIERLANDISHDVAGLCLDTGHLYYAGMDPLDWLDRYYHRLDYLHFKDIDPQVYQRAIHEGIDFFTACAEGVMCPLGSGAIDYPAIKDLSLIHISEPTRLGMISYAVFCLKKKNRSVSYTHQNASTRLIQSYLIGTPPLA